MKYDLSIVIPGIRTHNWVWVYESIKESCKKYSFEVIFSGPFDPPVEFANIANIKYNKTYSHPSTAYQMAVQFCEGRLLNETTDDAKFIPSAVDEAIDLYNKIDNYKTIINMRFTEGVNFCGKTFEADWWNAHYHANLRLPGVPSHYQIVLSPMMDIRYFKDFGGLDCAYEYPNFNTHDLLFRFQYDGCQIHKSPTDVNYLDQFVGKTGDHAPMIDAHEPDMIRFQEKYNDPNALRPDNLKIDLDNWKNYNEPWHRRFSKKLYTSYNEMMADI